MERKGDLSDSARGMVLVPEVSVSQAADLL